ncbi:MAG: hypothetical protein ACI89D_000009 [Bermanella sp.]
MGCNFYFVISKERIEKMNDVTKQFQVFVGNAIKVSAKAYELQVQFGQDLMGRAGKSAAEMAEDLRTHIEGFRDVKDPANLLKVGVEYQEVLAAKLHANAGQEHTSLSECQSQITKLLQALTPNFSPLYLLRTDNL